MADSLATIIDVPSQIEVGEINTREDLERAYELTLKNFKDGDVVRGRVLQIDKDEVLVDVGFKSEGVIPLRELAIRQDIDPHDEVKIGEEIDALVLQKEDKEGRLILSKKRAHYEKAWGDVEEKRHSGEIVTGKVIEQVKGGLIVDIGLRGFLPASLVDIRRVGDLDAYIGETLECKVIELDRNRNNVVLSRRAFLEDNQKEARGELLGQLKKGDIREGRISSIVKFGAFVDLGGIDGLVHVSELSWQHVEDPHEVVAVGDEVKVQILEIEEDRERISLSLKATQEDPWEAFARVHQIGDVIDGTVTKLVSFGAFVSVGAFVEGLVHISELAVAHIQAPAEVVAVNDIVKVRVIDVDAKRRRVSLSVKQAVPGYVPEANASKGPLRQDQFLEDATPDFAPEPASHESVPAEDGESVSTDTLEAFVKDFNATSAPTSTGPEASDTEPVAPEASDTEPVAPESSDTEPVAAESADEEPVADEPTATD